MRCNYDVEKGYRVIGGHGRRVGADDECLGLGRSAGSLAARCGCSTVVARVGEPFRPVPQSQVAYQTVNTVQCVQVPVTQYADSIPHRIPHRECAGDPDGAGDGQRNANDHPVHSSAGDDQQAGDHSLSSASRSPRSKSATGPFR